MNRLTATNRLNDGGRHIVENPQARLNVVNPALREARNDLTYPPSADFRWDFTSSMIPQQSMGSIAFTRATTATVIDNEWIMRNCLSGEVRFTGARRVRNLTPYSQDVNFWNKWSLTVSGTKVAYTDGSLIGQTIISDAATAVHYVSNGTWPVIIWNTYLFSVSVKAAWVNYVQLAFAASTAYQNFNLTNWSMTGTAGAGSVVDEWNGWYRCTVKFVSTLGTNAGQGIAIISSMSDGRLQSSLWDGISGISVCRMQLEDVTGQSIQTPSEYVSTNVLTTAPFHGANVDWVKYFNTTLAGDTISPTILKGYKVEGATTNLLTQSNTFSSWTKNFAWMTVTANQWTGPDGANSLWKVIPWVGSALQSLYLTTTVTAAVHTYTVYAKAGENGYLQLLTSGAISNGYINFDLFTGTIGASSLWTGSISPVAWFPWIYKCVAITNVLMAVTGYIHISQVPTNTTGRAGSMTGDWVSGLYVWWAQLELWSMSTSHLFTTGSTVTRNDDILSYNVNNFNNVYGGVYAEVFTDWTGTVTSNVLQTPRIFGSSWWSLLYLHGTNALTNNDGGTAVSGMDITAGSTVQKVWLTYSATRNFFCNWVADTGKAYDGNMSITGLIIGNSSGGTRALYGNIRNVKIWKTPPTDAEMVSITS